VERAKLWLYEGFAYYLKSFLFVRPVSRILRRFIVRVLMHQHHEFGPHNVFLVFNRNIGALLVDRARYCAYCLGYEKKPVKYLSAY